MIKTSYNAKDPAFLKSQRRVGHVLYTYVFSLASYSSFTPSTQQFVGRPLRELGLTLYQVAHKTLKVEAPMSSSGMKGLKQRLVDPHKTERLTIAKGYTSAIKRIGSKIWVRNEY